MIPESGRPLGEGNGNPLQYSCLGNPMERGAWWAIYIAHGGRKRVGHNLVTKNKQTRKLCLKYSGYSHECNIIHTLSPRSFSFTQSSCIIQKRSVIQEACLLSLHLWFRRNGGNFHATLRSFPCFLGALYSSWGFCLSHTSAALGRFTGFLDNHQSGHRLWFI